MKITKKERAMRALYGSWIESGDEDAILAEIYASRLIPSSQPAEDDDRCDPPESMCRRSLL